MHTVADLMTEDPRTVGPKDSLVEVLDVMLDLEVRHVPVVEDDGVLVGLISQRDLLGATAMLRELPLTQHRQALAERRADSVMVTGVETVEPETPLRDVGELMLENKFGCVLVCEGEHLVGILTEADFVRFVVEVLGEE